MYFKCIDCFQWKVTALCIFKGTYCLSPPTPCRVLRHALLRIGHYKKFLPTTFGYSEGEDHSVSLPQE